MAGTLTPEARAAKRRLWRREYISCDAADVTVTTLNGNDAVVNTLVGNYREICKNHGRKFYEKIEEIEGHDGLKVFLYFWDHRDGGAWAGWWFGTELGSRHCWARCSTANPAKCGTPPRTGWKIPWDADRPEPGNLFVDIEEHRAPVVTTLDLRGLSHLWVASEDVEAECVAIGDVMRLGGARGGFSRGKLGVAVLESGATIPVQLVKVRDAKRRWTLEGEGSLKQWIRDRRAALAAMGPPADGGRPWVDDDDDDGDDDRRHGGGDFNSQPSETVNGGVHMCLPPHHQPSPGPAPTLAPATSM